MQQAIVDDWNAAHEPGIGVIVTDDIGNESRTKTRSCAELLGGHTPVVWLAGRSGCYALDRVRAIGTGAEVTPASARPPDRWVCPECGEIVEEIVWATLPRTLVRGPGGKYTQIECPICKHTTVGMAWAVVEITGTEEIT